MNWPVLILVGIAAIALIIFLVVRNQKDETVLEDQLNEDYPKKEDNAEEVINREEIK